MLFVVSNDFYAEHRQVVVRIGAVAMFLHLRGKQLDGLLGTLEGRGLKNLQQTFIGELRLLAVLGLVKTIGIDKQRLVADIVDFLAFIIKLRHQTDWQVWNHLDELGLTLADEYGWVVACVAEVEMTCGEVYQSDKHRNEHALLVVVT